jgi:hypothetical protein
LDTSYGHIEAAGFDSLAFRRGGDRVRVPVRVPGRTRQYP